MKHTTIALLAAMGLALLSGCSALKIKACLPGAAECTEITSRGETSLDQPAVMYERTMPDGSTIRFTFNAASTERKGSTLETEIAKEVGTAIANRLTGGPPQ